MYECPNCAANLRFDIPSQKLKCESCGTFMNPYDFQKDQDGLETVMGEDEYEVTVFACPQCGGELVSSDITAATFCSFCGGSTILDSRISRKKRPKLIIPFQKTKEDCKTAYKKLMRRALFVPSEMMDERYIERFMGIYMPYWVYNFEKNGHVTFTGTQSQRNGDYVITKYYKIESDLQSEYRGITFDAAAAFPDDLSNAIAPFKWREAVPFTPSFLSGFYADTGDVVSPTYQKDARAMVLRDMCNKMQKGTVCRNYELERDFVKAMAPKLLKQDLVMFPVWFLTYRRNDRVNYVVVNGQTGKVAGDVPVDPFKYLRASVLCAIPIFFLIVIMKAPVILAIAAVMALLACVVSIMQTKRIRSRGLIKSKGCRSSWGSFGKSLIKPGIGLLAAILVLAVKPVSDLYYYGAGLIAMGLTGWNILDMIQRYNLLATRELPQLYRRGGG